MKAMNKLSVRLKELRTEKGLTLKQVSAELSIPLQTYANYEHGTREPPLDLLIAVCEFYNVSADYLLGIEDETGARVHP